MYIVPLTTYPNQTFVASIPINGENKELKFKLWYNQKAEYWLMDIYDNRTDVKLLSNIPLLTSTFRFFDVLCQFAYKEIGKCMMVPLSGYKKGAADDKTLGSTYIMAWGDNGG